MENCLLYVVLGLILGSVIAFLWDELERSRTSLQKSELWNRSKQEHLTIKEELQRLQKHPDPVKYTAIEKCYEFCLSQNRFALKDIEKATIELQDWYKRSLDGDSIYRFNFPEKEMLKFFPLETLHILNIINEGLHNAAIHSQANFIFSIASVENNRLNIITHDNGIGYNRKEIDDGNGIQKIREATEKLNGDLKLTSTIGNGTIVNFEKTV
ncbi:MAG: histidine kinase [Nonlabens sp.]|uniref:histidine kinase n=1 Tax=Nonlabens sp. TaxID=1888209 RepID=UPI003EF181A9